MSMLSYIYSWNFTKFTKAICENLTIKKKEIVEVIAALDIFISVIIVLILPLETVTDETQNCQYFLADNDWKKRDKRREEFASILYKEQHMLLKKKKKKNFSFSGLQKSLLWNIKIYYITLWIEKIECHGLSLYVWQWNQADSF